MGALETLYAMVYGKTPGGGGESDLLGAPDRLKLYALQKMLQGNQAIGDYHDWMNDLDIEARGREGKSFDEDYLDPGTRKRIASSRQEYASKKMEELQASRIAEAEKSGEVTQKRGGSPYRAAESIPSGIARPTFDQMPVGEEKPGGYSKTDFGSLMDRYVADAEKDYGWEERAEQERRDNSVNIDIPGGYESLERIARQAIAKGRGGGELVFGDPDAEQHYLMGGRKAEWPYEVSRQYPDTEGISVPGGTFRQMGRTLTGGDSEEDMRRYVDEIKRNQTAIKIATIEASAPAKYRSPKTNEYLDMLYEQKAEEEATEVSGMNAAANMRQAQTESEITGPALAKYHGEYNPAQVRVAELGVEEAKLRNQGAQAQDDRIYWGQVVDDLRMQAKDDPVLMANLPQIMAIIYDSTLSSDHKKLAVSQLMAKPVGDADAKLADVDKKLWYTPGG